MNNRIETAGSRVRMPAMALLVLAMSLFMQQITSSSQVLSNALQEALSRIDSRCRLIKTDRFEFLLVVLLASLKDAMQICGKLPGQETLVDKFPIKETDGALVFARYTVIEFRITMRSHSLPSPSRVQCRPAAVRVTLPVCTA